MNYALGQDINAPLPDDLYGKVSAIVTYKKIYVDDINKSVNLSFSLIRDVTVNATIGKYTLNNGNELQTLIQMTLF